MDYFKTQINTWADWDAARQNSGTFEALIKQIFLSENEPFKTPEAVFDEVTATFAVGPTLIVIFPPNNVLAATRDRYQTERFSLTRMDRLKLTAPKLLHTGFIFDAYQFYYVICKPLAGVTLAEFARTAEPLAKSTLGRQIGTALNQMNAEVGAFNRYDGQQASDAARWDELGSDFKAARQGFIAAHPVTTTDFVHGRLNGDNLVVTSGQVGFQHFGTAHRAPRQTELVPLIMDAFAADSDFIAGLRATLQSTDLVTDVLLGILWRADGPDYVSKLMDRPVTLESLQAKLTQLLTKN